jgi:hypothetical protein
VLGLCGCCETLLEEQGLQDDATRKEGIADVVTDIVAVAAGTGATLAGLLAAAGHAVSGVAREGRGGQRGGKGFGRERERERKKGR